MSSTVQDFTSTGYMTEQVVATDFLLGTKTAIKNYALALSETASPQVRTVLRRHLDVAIGTHEKITTYMMNKGYYHAYNPQEQFKFDMKAADTVLGLQIQG